LDTDRAPQLKAIVMLLLWDVMKILCFIAVLLITSTVVAAKPSNRQLLLSMHKSLDAMCRGGSGDSPATDDACRVRTTVSDLLRTIGNRNTPSNSEVALSIYKDLNEMCRGGSGDRSETQQACAVRNKASALLRNMGYCWRGAWWQKCRL
jgi:hypothetical protein